MSDNERNDVGIVTDIFDSIPIESVNTNNNCSVINASNNNDCFSTKTDSADEGETNIETKVNFDLLQNN